MPRAEADEAGARANDRPGSSRRPAEWAPRSGNPPVAPAQVSGGGSTVSARVVGWSAAVSPSVLRRVIGVDRRAGRRTVAAGFSGVAGADPDMAAIQIWAGRPR